MAGNISNYAELKILEHSVGKTAWTLPSCYVALFTATPSDSGGGTEITGGAYARQQIAGAGWAAAANGSITTAADVTFPQATADWGTITSVGLFDASTAGNLIWWGPLTVNKTVTNGDIFKIVAGNLTLSLD